MRVAVCLLAEFDFACVSCLHTDASVDLLCALAAETAVNVATLAVRCLATLTQLSHAEAASTRAALLRRVDAYVAVQCLTSLALPVRLRALELARNLCCDQEKCPEVMQQGGLGPIVHIMLEGPAASRACAVESLALLAAAHPREFDNFHSTGITPKLLQVIVMDASLQPTVEFACIALAMVSDASASFLCSAWPVPLMTVCVCPGDRSAFLSIASDRAQYVSSYCLAVYAPYCCFTLAFHSQRALVLCLACCGMSRASSVRVQSLC